MAKTTQISVRIDNEVKENADKVLKEMGLSMSTALNLFLVKVARERRIPFEVTAYSSYEPNEKTYKAMEKAEKDEDMYGPFDSVNELMEALNA